MPSQVKIDSRAIAVQAQINQNLSNAVGAMANAILSTSRMKAPKKDNHLRSSATIRGSGLQRDIVYGQGLAAYGKGFNYAAYQENKEKTARSHYTTPGTGPHFLEESGDSIAKKGIGAFLK